MVTDHEEKPYDHRDTMKRSRRKSLSVEGIRNLSQTVVKGSLYRSS